MILFSSVHYVKETEPVTKGFYREKVYGGCDYVALIDMFYLLDRQEKNKATLTICVNQGRHKHTSSKYK